jgi:hypothetical protein
MLLGYKRSRPTLRAHSPYAVREESPVAFPQGNKKYGERTHPRPCMLMRQGVDTREQHAVYTICRSKCIRGLKPGFLLPFSALWSSYNHIVRRTWRKTQRVVHRSCKDKSSGKFALKKANNAVHEQMTIGPQSTKMIDSSSIVIVTVWRTCNKSRRRKACHFGAADPEIKLLDDRYGRRKS